MDGNFCDLTTFRIVFSHILTAHEQKQLGHYFSAATTPLEWIQRPRFLIRGDISAIGLHILFLLGTFYTEIRHISISGLLDLIFWKAHIVLPWRSGYLPPSLKLIRPAITETWHLYLQYLTYTSGGRLPGRNQLCQISFQPVQGFWFCTL